MLHFVLITNEYKDENLRLSTIIAEYIEEKGGTVHILLGLTKDKDHPVYTLNDIPNDTDCILVLGGDGTLIRTAVKVQPKQIPMIGVNLGNLGYLCELEESNVYSALDAMMSGSCLIEERMMLTGHRNGDGAFRNAMNDIVIHRSGGMSVLSLMVYVNGDRINTYHGDGIIVATPTGSTGYSMSAGGPIVDPKTKMILLTPINAHNLNAKSIVFHQDDRIEIEIGARRIEKDETAVVTFDGDYVTEMKVGERFVIQRAEGVGRICRISKKSFLEALRKKMQTYE